jgi:hypothetical protein
VKGAGIVKREIYCCGCQSKVSARLTDGKEIYPHRKDLYSLPFWRCDACGNYVGCHHKTKDRTRPLGNIPTPNMRIVRKEIHKILDPLWEGGAWDRKKLYRVISDRIGWTYHTAKIRSIEEARDIYQLLQSIHRLTY